MSRDSREPQYRDMTTLDLLRFFDANPEADEYTWINGSKVRFSDVLCKARGEIEDAHAEREGWGE